MKKKFIVWLSIFLSLSCLTLPSRSGAVTKATGRASKSHVFPVSAEVDQGLLLEAIAKAEQEYADQVRAYLEAIAAAEKRRLEELKRKEELRKQREREQRASRSSPGSIGTRIANCEGGQAYLHKDHGPESTASGKYGFLDGTWDGLDGVKGNGFRGYSRAMYAPESVQDEGFAILWNDGKGASHWKASRHCWG